DVLNRLPFCRLLENPPNQLCPLPVRLEDALLGPVAVWQRKREIDGRVAGQYRDSVLCGLAFDTHHLKPSPPSHSSRLFGGNEGSRDPLNTGWNTPFDARSSLIPVPSP